MYDVDNKRYFDFLSAYSAVNQGHCHPRLVKKIQDQAATLTLTSRAFHNDKLAVFAKYITEMFGYDKVRRSLLRPSSQLYLRRRFCP